jgi:UDP-3-O-[3-hydroxymyristoyl] N-acetylglucosamine deacetylase/3-hydroxyacyl-[acyl-carrier-protein] dehydratase
MDKGLIKGGSLENAVVVRGDNVLSKEPLRYRDEFVRHKILDIIGDLSLFGRPLRGHVMAVKPGHGPNTDLARAVAKQFARQMALVPPGVTPKGGDILDVNDVMKLLPHRYPFLMVDRIVSIDETKCTGVKFRKPVVPGDTLFIEVEMTQKKRAICKAKGRCIVNGEVVSEAEMLFGIVDK